MASFQFVICVQSLGGDIGSECLQSNDSYSLDAFGDIRRADSGPTWPCGHTLTHDRVLRTVELSSEGVSEVGLTLESIGGRKNGPD